MNAAANVQLSTLHLTTVASYTGALGLWAARKNGCQRRVSQPDYQTDVLELNLDGIKSERIYDEDIVNTKSGIAKCAALSARLGFRLVLQILRIPTPGLRDNRRAL